MLGKIWSTSDKLHTLLQAPPPRLIEMSVKSARRNPLPRLKLSLFSPTVLLFFYPQFYLLSSIYAVNCNALCSFISVHPNPVPSPLFFFSSHLLIQTPSTSSSCSSPSFSLSPLIPIPLLFFPTPSLLVSHSVLVSTDCIMNYVQLACLMKE